MSEQDPSKPPRNALEVGRYRALAWTDEHVRRFWEYESQFPDNYFSYKYRDRLVPRLRGLFTGKKRVLDFGCGGGFLIPSVPNFGGADSPMEALDSELEFDGILAVEVIEHLSDQQLASTFDIIWRMLEPGGVIVFTTAMTKT